MEEKGALDRGRASYERREWGAARDALDAANGARPLEGDDLWRLAASTYLTGRETRFLELLERAYQEGASAGDRAGASRAARAAFWLGLTLAERGEHGPATGWLGRAARLVERAGGDVVERGYLLLPRARQRLAAAAHGPDSAYDLAGDAAAIGDRFGDPDLVALAVHLQGVARVREGRVEEGLALMDEAMVGVATGEVSPLVTGLVYCSVIGACRRVYALGRAHQWTDALDAWCRTQPDLVPYRGECRVYRAEVLQLHGDWEGTLDELRRAAESVAGPSGRGVAALAAYQEGEVHRLRGELAAAEAAYGRARELGREPQPGLALLRLAQGEMGAAEAAIRRALLETDDPLARCAFLPAAVEVGLTAGDEDTAARACAELQTLAERYGTEMLWAMAAQCRGHLELVQGDPAAALAPLRRAAAVWQTLEAPYQGARVRVLLARACRQLGDDDTAALELEAARAGFERLGAASDLVALDAAGGGGRGAGRDAHGLTPRELQVLRLVATGRTNRAIAGDLFISEKTVARHVSNIYAKLGVSSRAAATTYAHRHALV